MLHSTPICVVDKPASEPNFRVTIWQPNSFTNPPQFAICPKLNFLILPRLAFISGRIALIFQNRFAFTSFFRNFASSKKNEVYEEKFDYYFSLRHDDVPHR